MKVSLFGCSRINFLVVMSLGIAGADNNAPDAGHLVRELLQEQDALWWLPLGGNDNGVKNLEGDKNHRDLQTFFPSECADTADWFGTRNSGGVNLFKEFFDCTCNGDLTTYYTYSCSLEDCCFDLDLVPDSPVDELCVNVNLTFDFSVNATPGEWTVERADRCFEYLNQGPSQPACFVDPAACAFTLLERHFYSTESAGDICFNTTLCPQVLTEELGHTQERMLELCPKATLGETECAGFGASACGETTDTTFFSHTHDCSNVEPCATQSCQEFYRVLPTPGRVVLAYPECPELADSPMGSPTITMTPTMVVPETTEAPVEEQEGETSSPAAVDSGTFQVSNAPTLLFAILSFACLFCLWDIKVPPADTLCKENPFGQSLRF